MFTDDHKPCLFYPRDAMLARYYSYGQVSVCLCRSVTSRIQVTSLIWLKRSSWFWHGGFLPPVLHCVTRKFGYLQNNGTSLWNFVPNYGLRKFRHGKSIALLTEPVDGRAC